MCLSLLELYAGLKGIGPKMSEKLDEHTENCEYCGSRAAELALLLATESKEEKLMFGEGKTMDLLLSSPEENREHLSIAAAQIFTNSEGREMAESLAIYEYDIKAVREFLQTLKSVK